MESVFGLVNALCESFCVNGKPEDNRKAVKLCRRKAFEILFEQGQPNNFNGRRDIIEDLKIHLFELKLRANTVKKRKHAEEFEELLHQLQKQEPLDESSANVLELLLELRESNIEYQRNVNGPMPPFLDKFPDTPSASVYAPIPSNRFSIHDPTILPVQKKEVPVDIKNPYIVNRRIKESESETSLNTVFNSSVASFDKLRSESDLKQRPQSLYSLGSGHSLSLDIGRQKPKQYFTREYNRPSSSSSKSNTSDNTIRLSRKGSGRGSGRSSGRHKRILNWEHIGNRNVLRELPFASESNSLLSLLTLSNEEKGKSFRANIIPLEAFMIDVKYLTVGISSESFEFDFTEMIFEMIPNLTVDDVSPIIFKTIVQDFIECGTCFKRLQFFTSRSVPYRCKGIVKTQDGFVFKALCDSIESFLMTFRKFVLSFDDTTILGYSHRISYMKKQLVALTKVLRIHPNVHALQKLPEGSEFLGFLYREIIGITQTDVSLFLVFILSNCCQVYFSNFEKWLFFGYFEDPCNELFICFVDAYLANTKSYFDKAFQIKKQSVPLFLQGYEEDILLCGKYTNLLRTYKPDHPIFTMERFKLRVCLNHKSIEQLQQKCNDYLLRAKQLCGETVKVADVFKLKYQKRALLQARIEENSKINMEKWKTEQEQKTIELQRFRMQQREELKLQMEEIREQKLAEKKANIERELMYLKEVQTIEDERLLAENVERKKRIEYYEELNRLLDEKRERTEKLVAKLKSDLKNKEHLSVAIYNQDGSGDTPDSDGIMAMSISSDNFSPEADDKSSGKLMSTSFSVSTPSLHETVMNENFKNQAVSPEPNMTSRNPIMQKSESDILNANADEEDMISDFQRNKRKVLGSHIFDKLGLDTITGDNTTSRLMVALTDAQRNKMRVLTQEYNLRDVQCQRDIDNNYNKMKHLTEAGKNKIKVLSSEFGIELDDVVLRIKDPSEFSDAERNRNKIMGTHYLENIDEKEDHIAHADRELTALQRNRLKTMQHEYELISPDEPSVKQKPGHLNIIITDRARNRKKVLESEFNILTGELNMESPDMNDLPALNIDPEVLFHEIPDSLGIPNTAVIEQPTPESALIGHDGRPSETGFRFTPSPKRQRPRMEVDGSTSNLSTITTNHIDTVLDSDPYYFDFVKKVERKMNSLMPLYLPKGERGSNQNAKYQHDSENVSYDSELKCLDVTTLTRFLQKSLVLPLNAHMEIINGEIMKLFLLELDVLGHFKSLRNYFFMMDGEFGSYICDGLLKRMESGATPNDLLNPQTLHSLLDNALGSSITGNDKNTDRLTFKVLSRPESFDLLSPDALNMLSLDYQVQWPLNLILNPDTTQEYSNIFKYLVKVRRIGWVLESSFQYLKDAHKEFGTDILTSVHYRRIQEVRHKLSQFMHALLNHITLTGLQVSWRSLKDDLNSTVTMEDLYRKHVKYIKRIKFLCMLTKPCALFHSMLETIFSIVLQFYRYLITNNFVPDPENDKSFIHPKYNQIVKSEKAFEHHVGYIIYLGNKMVNTGYQLEIGEFINLININGYYNKIKLNATPKRN